MCWELKIKVFENSKKMESSYRAKRLIAILSNKTYLLLQASFFLLPTPIHTHPSYPGSQIFCVRPCLLTKSLGSPSEMYLLVVLLLSSYKLQFLYFKRITIVPTLWDYCNYEM